MASKNRPKEVMREIVDVALDIVYKHYPEEKYDIRQEKNEIWVDTLAGEEVETFSVIRGAV